MEKFTLDTVRNLPRATGPFPRISHYKEFLYDLKIGERILDVGAGTPNMAGLYKKCLYECVELSRDRADVLRKAGIKVNEVAFEDFKSDILYDRVTMSQVLMHLSSAEDAIRKVHNLLKVGGLFISSQYNKESLIPQNLYGVFSLFTPKSLTELLERHGFKALFYRYRPTSIFNYLQKRKLSGIRKFILRLIDQPLKLVMASGSSDYFTIVARKVR